MSEDPDLRHVSFEGMPANGRGPHLRVQPGLAVAARLPAGRRAVDPAPSGPTVSFARWVLHRAGLDAASYRAESLRRRVPACLRALKLRTEREAQQRIARHPELLPDAVSSLLIGVTGFFRDPDVFDALRRCVLPALARRRGQIRAWSAACASGCELYSFAILLAEAGLLDRASLLGTDCRADVIEQARAASCSIAVARGTGDRFFARYFEAAIAVGWRPIEELRRRADWKVADVLKVVEPGPWDIIFWRNTAIYLNPGPATLVYHRLVAELSPGGFLVLGKAERPPETLDVVPVYRCLYRKGGA